MLTGLIAAYAAELFAALVFLPVLVVHLALFFERSGTPWLNSARRLAGPAAAAAGIRAPSGGQRRERARATP